MSEIECITKCQEKCQEKCQNMINILNEKFPEDLFK